MIDGCEVARLYETGLSQAEVGQILGISQPVVGRHLVKQGVRARSPAKRSYTLDEMYFDKIDTPAKAYWLGFVAADGYVPRDGTYLGIRLGSRDHAHLVKMVADLSSDAPVKLRDSGATSEVRFHSTALVAALAQHGVRDQKTYTCEPWDGPADLIAHYWRGAVDGDGHVSKSRPYVSYCGTPAMAEAFQRYAKSVCGVDSRLLHRNVIWVMNINGARQVRELLGDLYATDGPVLARKREAALAMIARCSERTTIICSVEGCGRRQIARKLCTRHYQRWRLRTAVPECSICGDPVVARGWCGMHYARWRSNGDPLVSRTRRSPPR